MNHSWASIAEGWHVTLDEFLGTRKFATLPNFDPFNRLLLQFQWHSVDAFSSVSLQGHPGFKAFLVKSKIAHERDTVILIKDGERVGFVGRHAEGCDTVSLHKSVRGLGLAAPMILAAMKLRAPLRYEPITNVVLATKSLFNGGSYSEAGIHAVSSAYRQAVLTAMEFGRPVSERVKDCILEATEI